MSEPVPERSLGLQSGPPPASEEELLAALRRGDEAAFVALVQQYHAALVRVAQGYVGSRAVAEEVAQETWLGVVQGLARFEGRSSLKTWLFRILMNRARTRAEREGRTIPCSALAAREAEGAETAVEPERFFGPGSPNADGWATPPQAWTLPEQGALTGELREQLKRAIDALPPAQRTVLTLRDIEGWPSGDVCNLLEISETNQRVLLHRARARVRRALEDYLTVT